MLAVRLSSELARMYGERRGAARKLSLDADVDPSTVYRILSGTIRYPHGATLDRVAAVLGVSRAYLERGTAADTPAGDFDRVRASTSDPRDEVKVVLDAMGDVAPSVLVSACRAALAALVDVAAAHGEAVPPEGYRGIIRLDELRRHG